MSKTLSFIQLDFLTIKSILSVRTVFYFVVVVLISVFGIIRIDVATGMLLSLGALFATYPFNISEKNNMDLLYTTLSIKRNDVVRGRYLYALLIAVLVGIVAIIMSFVIPTIMERDVNISGMIVSLIIMFVVFSLILAIQLPIFFKLGYAKAKLVFYLPFMILPIGFVLIQNLLGYLVDYNTIGNVVEWFGENIVVGSLVGIVIWFVLMCLSYVLSLTFYKKRDF